MEIVIILGLIVLNGFFSLSEIAIVSSKPMKLRQMEPIHPGATLALKLKHKSETFLSAIQIGITLIGLITGAYSGISFVDDVAPLLAGFSLGGLYPRDLAMVLIIAVITYASIVLGELVPKTMGLSNPEGIACKVAPIIWFISLVFAPLVKLLSVSTRVLAFVLRIRRRSEQITEEDLKLAIETASDEGVIEEDQESIHKNLFYFSDKKAKHLMTHRRNVEWINLKLGPIALEEALLEASHSLVVCCDHEPDAIVGILDMKDYLQSRVLNDGRHLSSMILKPLMVSANMDAAKLLEKFRSSGERIACVVNEHGGFEGIVTLHDIMEHIVGELPEDGDKSEPDIFVREDKSVLVSGDAPIETLIEVIEGFEVDFDQIEYATVAGFVNKELGTLPQVGDKFDFLGYTIEVVDTDAHRVDKVLIVRHPDI